MMVAGRAPLSHTWTNLRNTTDKKMPNRAYVSRVLARCDALRKTTFWTHQCPEIAHEAWLNNFTDEKERAVAAALLETFSFFSDTNATQLLRKALHLYLQERVVRTEDPHADQATAETFLRRTLITPVQGEHPNPSDSGYLLCRRVRQEVGIQEENLVALEHALQGFIAGRPVVFIDDIVGSGQQMYNTWTRFVPNCAFGSFQAVANAVPSLKAQYVCLAATQKGLDMLRQKIPSLSVHAAHILQKRDEFRIALRRLPEHPCACSLIADAESLLRKYGSNLDVPPYMDDHEQRAFGFNRLGLTIAFQHCIPDATLPIFWANGPAGWTPLMRRS